MHYKELTGKPYLSAEDLPENKDVLVIIEAAEREEAFNPRTKKPEPIGVLKFKGKFLKMVINTTNAKTISTGYGNETTAWIGKEIIIYRTMTRLGRDQVPCIRVKIPTIKNTQEVLS